MPQIHDFPEAMELPYARRVAGLKRVCLDMLSRTADPARLLDLVEACQENEDYELVQAIHEAAAEFTAKPQLSLF